MKINISGLMSLISEEERKFNAITSSLRTNIYSTSIQELNGTVNSIEDYQEEYQNDLEELSSTMNRISNLKKVLYEKNNSFKLSDGRTIQSAIIDNANLRKVKSTYEVMLNFRNVKKRVTEVNNSYFECKTINYDSKKLMEKLKEIDKEIQRTDFEISKLNSIEFEI